MSRSMLKFFEDQGGEDHGGQLHWPGTQDGYPLRGDAVPDLKQEEFEQIPLALDYKSGSFRLWDSADKAKFDLIMDRVVNGWYMQHKRFDNWIEEHQNYVVRLEWVQIYGESAGGKSPGVPADVQQTVQHTPGESPDSPYAMRPPGAGRTGQPSLYGQLPGRPVDPLAGINENGRGGPGPTQP